MIKKFKEYISEAYANTKDVKDDLAKVIDLPEREKDIKDVETKIEGTKDELLKKKKAIEDELKRLNTTIIKGVNPEDQKTQDKLIKQKVDKLKKDLESLNKFIKNLKTQTDALKK